MNRYVAALLVVLGVVGVVGVLAVGRGFANDEKAAGEMDVVNDTVSKLTGHPPMTLVGFLRRHAESYRHLLSA